MKRSSQVSLVLVASISATALLSGCDIDDPVVNDPGGTFSSIEECVAVYDQQTCEAAEKLARADHLKNAPKFNTLEACRESYGDMCRLDTNYGGSGNSFMPFMVGYMMGNSLSRPAPLYYGAGAYRYQNNPGYSAPIYTSGSGYSSSKPIGSGIITAPTASTTKGSLKSSTAMTPSWLFYPHQFR